MFDRFLKILLIFFVCLSMEGCLQSKHDYDDPKKNLSAYITKSFSVQKHSDREELMTFLTGNAKARLSAWSIEQFQEAFMDSKRMFQRLSIIEVLDVSKDEVSITYELSFVDQSKGKDAKVTYKKLCQMSLENGKWLIRDVYNIKELIEFKNELSLP